jgi:transcriptional regulator with XRE-family HTH domain
MADPPLGTELRDRRVKRDWTQEELATRIGVSEGAVVAAWENNHHEPNDEHAARLVELFGAAERDLSLYERRQSG